MGFVYRILSIYLYLLLKSKKAPEGAKEVSKIDLSIFIPTTM
ncbi:hypothetical protein HMP0015_1600 [Acinetobacter haemolyticus ATCC 19194]|uniref:Uncharacterized protein n=1 Tax=Acinetobacter haemolyticus ATCC 19194 TaxID=707232 RepID=D4XPF8_ACIHA|nr:hypothetical protein HMP0015_1600 [Acinetobacter haemolyticus ATCC 19194]